jgi:L-cysteine S-thiosulfotransferase
MAVKFLFVSKCILAGGLIFAANLKANAEPSAGNVESGRAIVANRQLGLCLLCHTGPIPEERFQGNIAPSLAGAGSRWTSAELRQRIGYARELNPQSIMPSYLVKDGFTRVALSSRGKSILTVEQVEDVVAYLVTLKQ